RDEPPTWMSQLESEPRKRSIPPYVPQMDFPVPEPTARPGSPGRELRVKVWEPEEEEDIIAAQSHSELRTGQDVRSEAVIESDTVPLSTHLQGQVPSSSRSTSEAASAPWKGSSSPGISQVPATPVLAQPQPSVQKQSKVAPAQKQVQRVPAFQPVLTPMPQAQAKAKQRRLLLVGPILLALLLIVGFVTWIVIAQPFTVASVTEPQQHLTNSSLRIALSYPNGWKSEVDASKTTLHLFDSSHTAQVNISVGTPNGDVNAILSQEAKQFGMTGLKAVTTQLFAGASWQELQGNVQQHGASYTETLFATIHNSRLYILAQLAPQAVYSDEEKLAFSGIRASFQFL
ncbi:MAG: hypothetical protein M3Z24_13690, partial [Chloroflexota bacterium]|nr:hypothetical protein [Chloroflexota bacterium]